MNNQERQELYDRDPAAYVNGLLDGSIPSEIEDNPIFNSDLGHYANLDLSSATSDSHLNHSMS